VIDKDETLLKVTDLQRLVECVIILFSPINFVRLWALLLLSVGVDTLDWNRYLELLFARVLGFCCATRYSGVAGSQKRLTLFCWVVCLRIRAGSDFPVLLGA